MAEKDRLKITLECQSRFNYALAQNDVPVVQRLTLHNPGSAPLASVCVRIRSEPELTLPWERNIASIPAGATQDLTYVDVAVSKERLAALAERQAGWLVVEAASGEGAAAETRAPIEFLARDEWAGAGTLPEILAAFVLPNDPAVAPLLERASRALEKSTGDAAFDGYSRKDPARVRAMAAALYDTLQGVGISYLALPAGFESTGQKIRSPGQVLGEKVATCLDLAAAYAACLEAAGLHSILVHLEGHCFGALWLEEAAFLEPAIAEPLRLRKRVDLEHILAVETSALGGSSKQPFSEAARHARRRLDDPSRFLFAVDVVSARRHRVRPLALPSAAGQQFAEPVSAAARTASPGTLAGPARPLPGPPAPPPAGTDRGPPAGRLDRWRRNLLDLSLRNRLLNFRETLKTIPVLSPNIAALEDALADGAAFTLHPTGSHSPPLGAGAEGEELASELAARRLRSSLAADDLDSRLLEIYRGAKLSLEESGANTLYLALGFLSWYEAESAEQRKAPILLLPLTLERKSIKEGFRLSLSDDEVRVNVTLLEKLEKEFQIRVQGLTTLPQDASGFDVRGILRSFREAVLDVDRWDVVEEAWIGLFSFNKFLMWRDLQERVRQLLENPIVHHLVETPNAPFEPGAAFPDPAKLDEDRTPRQTFCLRDADSSQLAAVFAAADGLSFVLEGPPGTGKSQTITNLISHCLAEGKSVLFVAEKQAALNVVHHRLSEVGLGPFCLELHSNKANKQQVIRQLGEALGTAGRSAPQEWEERARRLAELRAELNTYVQRLHRPRDFGESVFQVTSRLIALAGAPRVPLEAAAVKVDRERLALMRDAVARVQATAAALGDMRRHPWQGARREEWDPAAGPAATAIAERLETAAALFQPALAEVAAALEFDAGGKSMAALAFLSDAIEALLDSPGPPAELLLSRGDEASSRIKSWVESGRRRDALRSELEAKYDARLFEQDLEALRGRLDRALGWFPPISWLLVWAARRRLRPFVKGPLPSGRDLAADLGRAMELKAVEAGLSAAAPDARRLLGKFWNEGRAKWDEVSRIVDWLHRFRKALQALAGGASAIPGGDRRWIDLASTGRDSLAPGAPLGRTLQTFRDRWRELRAALAAAVSFLDLDAASSGGGPAETDPIGRLRERAAAWKGNAASLRDWCAWRRARRSAVDLGLEPIVKACEDGELPAAGLPAAFERSFHETWLEETLRGEPVLRDFFSPQHEERIRQFRRLDRELLELARQEVVARLSACVPAAQAGEANTSSEVGILHRELKKQRRHLPVRQLVEKLPNLLPRLKPCLLMSPLSVAQYLDPAYPMADIVVFDEASQIPVWDAVGAISRGRQVIVVGDSKQLPPTMFFEKVAGEEAVEEDEVVDLESILDECVAAGLPQRYLEWHYRSRHESLIAFSNRQYYQDRLITFPSAARRTDGLGVSLVRVAGVYDRGNSRTNVAEAEAVAAEVVRRMRDPLQRRRSIGIVTFSLPQQLLVEDLLEKQRRRDPELDSFLSASAAEPLFVKNLENVQGDERDVILFSVGYGPDDSGRVAMNFGPLNREGGQRRLNVAVTRAREQVIVFSSLGADAIDLGRTRAIGVQHLKMFLEYAERGPAALAGAPGGAAAAGGEAPFEDAVREALAAKGWQVDRQVGCSGYRLDLAVKDPRRPDVYLLGIECDGASYGSARTARDRDRLRSEVLARLGWRLLRVWSNDWWHKREAVLEELDRKLARALEESPDAPREPEAAAAPVISAAPPAAVAPAAPATPPALAEPRAASPEVVPPKHTAQKDTPSKTPAPKAAEPKTAEPPVTVTAAPPVAVTGEAYQPYRPQGGSPARGDLLDPSSSKAVGELLLAIVNQESPVSSGRVAKLVSESWGLDRLTARARSHILEVARGVSSVRLIEGFFWKEGDTPEKYRRFRKPTDDSRTSREAEDIALEEVANAAEALLRAQISLPLEEFAKETAHVLGFDRLGPKVKARMVAGIQRLAERGGCSLTENVVTIVES